MEAQEAKRLRQETFGKSCIHEAVEMEYEAGIELGYMACTDCGTEFLDREKWGKIRENLQLGIGSM